MSAFERVSKLLTYCRTTMCLSTSRPWTKRQDSTFVSGQLARQLKSQKLYHRHCCKYCCQIRDDCYCYRQICAAGCCQSSTCCSGGAAALSSADRGFPLIRRRFCRCLIFSYSKEWKCLVVLICVVIILKNIC